MNVVDRDLKACSSCGEIVTLENATAVTLCWYGLHFNCKCGSSLAVLRKNFKEEHKQRKRDKENKR